MSTPNTSKSSLLIRHKIWLGFSSVLLILLINSLISLNSLHQVKGSVSTVVNKNQPLVIASLELSEILYKANGFLGFYLLSKDEGHKKAYLDSIKQIHLSFEELKSASDEQY
ncbi:MAG: MCP four helix bundle domain-containing protein, partial [gamma proteobacterium symbiont of Bathyaustriella thionipta]|nr:MCP four helix bundle domain-containing protein [gamma proteobacterium symbiont of Bathyaustriella thionipta]